MEPGTRFCPDHRDLRFPPYAKECTVCNRTLLAWKDVYAKDPEQIEKDFELLKNPKEPTPEVKREKLWAKGDGPATQPVTKPKLPHPAPFNPVRPEKKKTEPAPKAKK